MTRAAREYICTECGNHIQDKAHTVAKKVTFLEVGEGGRILRSRTTAWLCPDCTVRDADYQRPAFKSAPGYASNG